MQLPLSRARRRAVFFVVFAFAATLFSSMAAADPVEDLLCAVGIDDVNSTLGVECAVERPVDVVVCEPNVECQAEVEDLDGDGNSNFKTTMTGTSPTGGTFFLSLATTDDEEDCDLPLYVPYEVRFDTPGFTGGKVLRNEMSKADRQAEQNVGVDQIGACYESPRPFEDRDGNLTTKGLLRDCQHDVEGTFGDVPVIGDAVEAPCLHRHAMKGARAVINVIVPEGFGDPVYHLVEDGLCGALNC